MSVFSSSFVNCNILVALKCLVHLQSFSTNAPLSNWSKTDQTVGSNGKHFVHRKSRIKLKCVCHVRMDEVNALWRYSLFPSSRRTAVPGVLRNEAVNLLWKCLISRCLCWWVCFRFLALQPLGVGGLWGFPRAWLLQFGLAAAILIKIKWLWICKSSHLLIVAANPS